MSKSLDGIFYGSGVNQLNVTEKFIQSFTTNNKIIIPKGVCFNETFGDPCPNVVKEIVIYVDGILVHSFQ